MRLTRSIPSETHHSGFIVGVGRDFVLLHQFHDFYPEGLTALRVKDITNVRSGKFERLWERMLAAEGVLVQSALPADLRLADVSELLKALQQRGENIILECEDPEADQKDFYIGQILSVDYDSVVFANFDGLGHWDEVPHTIPYKEITKLQFDTPYVNTFSKYLEADCPHKSDCD